MTPELIEAIHTLAGMGLFVWTVWGIVLVAVAASER